MAIGISTYRPLITGTTHMVSTGHYLATSAGYRILEQGGNATDAGVAAGIALNVALPQYTSFGGVAPIIVHDSAKQETMQAGGPGRPASTISTSIPAESYLWERSARLLRQRQTPG